MPIASITNSIRARKLLPFVIGSLFILCICLINLRLGQNAFIRAHDQLDGAVIGYILQVRNGIADFFPEFMGGMYSDSIMLPSPGSLVFFYILSPFRAFLINMFLVYIISYVGMYFLICEYTGNRVVSSMVAVTYCLLPFIPIYGLSVMGGPLFIYGITCIVKGRNLRNSYFLICIFALFSSLVLVGWFYVIFTIVLTVILALKRKASAKRLLYAGLILIAVYLATNIQLLRSIFFSDTISHRDGWVPVNESSFFTDFVTALTGNQFHRASNHQGILLLAIVILIICIVTYKTKIVNANFRKLFYLCLGILLLTTAFANLWNTSSVITVRELLGGPFVSFQADRILWIYPGLWFFILGICTAIVYKNPDVEGKKFFSFARRIVSISLCLTIAGSIYLMPGNIIRSNISLLTQSSALASHNSWRGFYLTDVFAEIKSALSEPVQDYRVASIGLHPAVALYNGFYTIDGYSSQFDINYKTRFRGIIENELAKDTGLREYFDGWGSRIYLMADELGVQANPNPRHNNRIKLRYISLNTNIMKEMGVRYLFSASEIESPYMQGMHLVGQFLSSSTGVSIWVYQI